MPGVSGPGNRRRHGPTTTSPDPGSIADALTRIGLYQARPGFRPWSAMTWQA